MGDGVLAIDDEKVECKDACKALVEKCMGDPFDMMLERPPAPPLAPASAPSAAPASSGPAVSSIGVIISFVA